MKKNKLAKKSTTKTTVKVSKPIVKVTKSNTSKKIPTTTKDKSLKSSPVSKQKVTLSVVKSKPAKDAAIEKATTGKIDKSVKTPKVAEVKSSGIEKTMAPKNNNQSLAQARVIEPLSWDAEKPKLNLTLTNKVSRKDLKDKEDAEVKSYTIKTRYTVGDRVMHTDFGKGLVRDLIGDFKIRVAFRDFEKVLVHGIN